MSAAQRESSDARARSPSLGQNGRLFADGPRRYALSPQGQELVAVLDAAHREGIQAYVDQLGPEELERLRNALAIKR